MSGHSKWSTIKHKKAKTDAQRGKIFTKIVRELTSAARLAGLDPEGNPRLRLAMEKARDVNMPQDNIKRAIQKGAGGESDEQFEEVTFEAYAPDGVAMLIETLTDNRNRTVPSIRSVLTKAGGQLAAKGAVSYLFDKKGFFVFEPGTSEDSVMEAALAANAEDVQVNDDGSIEVQTAPEWYEAVKQAFLDAKLVWASASLTFLPKVWVAVAPERGQKIVALIDKLEEDDDVQAVYTNADVA